MADVGAIPKQIAEYYLKSQAVTFVAPADSLNLDRGFRLWMLERIMRYLKFEGRAIRVFLVGKVAPANSSILILILSCFS